MSYNKRLFNILMKGNISSKQSGCTKLMIRIAMKGAHVNVGREGSSDEAGGRQLEEASNIKVESGSSSTSLSSSHVKRAVVSFDLLRLGVDISTAKEME